jgi:hypothetical protein
MVPLVSLAIISSLTIPSYTVARTDAIAYVGFVVWAALGLRGLPRWGRWPVIAILLCSTVLATAQHMPVGDQRRQNDRLLGDMLREEVRDGDWVAFVGAAMPSIDYYLSNGRPGRPDSTITRIQYPAIFSGNPASDQPISGDSLRVWEEEALRIRNRFEEQDGPPDQMFYWIGPIQPGKARREPTAEDLYYPGSMLAYAFNGLRPLRPLDRRRGDELSVDWLVFRVRRDRLIPQVQIQPVIRGD